MRGDHVGISSELKVLKVLGQGQEPTLLKVLKVLKVRTFLRIPHFLSESQALSPLPLASPNLPRHTDLGFLQGLHQLGGAVRPRACFHA